MPISSAGCCLSFSTRHGGSSSFVNRGSPSKPTEHDDTSFSSIRINPRQTVEYDDPWRMTGVDDKEVTITKRLPIIRRDRPCTLGGYPAYMTQPSLERYSEDVADRNAELSESRVDNTEQAVRYEPIDTVRADMAKPKRMLMDDNPGGFDGKRRTVFDRDRHSEFHYSEDRLPIPPNSLSHQGRTGEQSISTLQRSQTVFVRSTAAYGRAKSAQKPSASASVKQYNLFPAVKFPNSSSLVKDFNHLPTGVRDQRKVKTFFGHLPDTMTQSSTRSRPQSFGRTSTTTGVAEILKPQSQIVYPAARYASPGSSVKRNLSQNRRKAREVAVGN